MCCRAINDRQIDELNQRLANANHQVEAEDRDEEDSISGLLGLPRRHAPPQQPQPQPQPQPEILKVASISPPAELVEVQPAQRSDSSKSARPAVEVTEKLVIEETRSVRASSAATDQYSGYAKITTPSMQKQQQQPESLQFAPSNRVYLKQKNGRVSSSGSQSGYDPSGSFLDAHRLDRSAQGSGHGHGGANGQQQQQGAGHLSVGTSILAVSSMMAAVKQMQPGPASGETACKDYFGDIMLTAFLLFRFAQPPRGESLEQQGRHRHARADVQLPPEHLGPRGHHRLRREQAAAQVPLPGRQHPVAGPQQEASQRVPAGLTLNSALSTYCTNTVFANLQTKILTCLFVCFCWQRPLDIL